jgi:cyanophycin synthetase
MSESAARRITGRHLMLDGPGALAEIATADVDRVVTRLRIGLGALGWPDAVWRTHRRGTSIGMRSPADRVDTAVDLLDWAIGDGNDRAELERILRRPGNPRLLALLDAYPGLAFEGEDLVTVGLGVHARSFRPDALPSPGELGAVRGIPIATVTGTNGKTTTTRLLAHLAQSAGLTAGRTSSDGVVIGDDTVERGDWTGPGASRRVLRDNRVQVAVLETARGGILRRGLAIEGADVAVVTNVTPEHLGEWGVDDLVTMARAKLVIAEALRRGGTLVVPARSEPLAAALPALLARRPDLVVRTFSSHPPGEGRPPDGWADDRYLHVGASAVPLAEIPIAFDGTARHNVENALAATLAALGLGIPGDAISRGLRTFRPSVADNPGRMNTYRLPSGALAVIDFAHNADGLLRIAETIRKWPRSRRTLLIGQAGDRPDADLWSFAAAAVPLAPHRIVLKDVTGRLYDRRAGEVPAIMERALLAHGVPPGVIVGTAPDESTGVRVAIRGAGADDVIVLLLHETLAAAVEILDEAGAVPLDP